MYPFVAVGPLFGSGFGGGGYTFTVPGLPPAAHAMTKTNFLFEHSEYKQIFYTIKEKQIFKSNQQSLNKY